MYFEAVIDSIVQGNVQLLFSRELVLSLQTIYLNY